MIECLKIMQDARRARLEEIVSLKRAEHTTIKCHEIMLDVQNREV